MPAVRFDPTISADERPQTYTLDRAATGTGTYILVKLEYYIRTKILVIFSLPTP